MAKEEDSYLAMSFEDSEAASFLPKQISSVINRRRNIWNNKFSLLGWLLAVVLFAINYHQWKFPRKPTDLECTRQLNAWSPVFDVVEYEDVQFSNTFFQPSPYRGKPTPELEKAWSDLWKIGVVEVPFEQLPALNKSQDHPWYRSENGGVMAGLEVFHSLHCLDMVRQYTWKDEYDYSDNESFQDDDEFLRIHVDHCIDALRIRLMCYADVTPFLHELEPAAELGATPDFNTQHRCKKYDKIQEWQRTHLAHGAPGQRKVDSDDHSHHHS